MGTAPLFPLLLSMGIPGLLGTMTTYLYRTVDQVFVGNYVGRYALGGLSVLAPFNNVMIALSLFITVGGASLLSLAIGSGNDEKAGRLFTNIIVQATGMATVVSLVFSVSAEPFVRLCGASEETETYRYAVEYLRIVSLGQVFNMLNVGLAAIIRTEGSAGYSMAANMIGAVCNIILDYFLIARGGMGVEGAALATVISQMAGAAFSAAYFLTGRSGLKWAGFSAVDGRQMIYIIKMGIAPSIFQMLSFVTNIMMNKALLKYGDLDPVYSLLGGGELCVSAMAAAVTMESFIVSLTSGINQAASPVISYNYGARKYSRVKKASLISQSMTVILSAAVWAAMMAVPAALVRMFGAGDEAFVTFGAHAMRICKILALFSGYQMLVSMYFSAIGRSDQATLVSFSRHGIFLIPALLLFPRFFGLAGVLYAAPFSDACSLLVVSCLYGKDIRRVGRLRDGETVLNKNRFISAKMKEKTAVKSGLA